MNYRFYNARILTMEKGVPICFGELWVEGNRITHVGAEKKKHTSPIPWDREIDVQGNLLMPGFKNAHTHSAMTFLRSYADDLSLSDWLYQKVFPMESKLTEEEMYHFSKLAIMEYLTSGITANFDMYLRPSAMVQASVDCGFRTVICGAVNDFTQSVKEVENDYNKYNHFHELIQYQLGFHAEYTTSKEILEGIAALSRKYQAPVYAHMSETEAEVRQCRERNGTTPIEYLDSLGMFSYGGGGFHCVHVTERELAILKERKLFVITNPASNLKLASGVAPVTEMARRGIALAIGTDGAASNNCLDMFREMFLVTGLAKMKEGNAAAMKGEQVLSMAVSGGALAMQLTDCDTLTEGKKADLIMLDLAQPNMQPIHNISKNIVYSGSKQNVKMTVVNGKILYEDGEFYIGTDSKELYEKVNGIVSNLQSRE